MNKKILHLVYSMGYGGLEQVIVNLINNSEKYNVEHCIVTLTDEQEICNQISPPCKIFNLGKKPGKDFSIHWKLFKLLRKLKVDVFHTYNFGTVEYHYIAKLAGVKRQVHCEHGRGGDDPDGMNYWHNLIRNFSINFMQKYIVVSPDLYNWALKTLRIDQNKLSIIYNGVNLDEYYPSDKKSSIFTICTVGRANKVKNQELLIESFNKILNEYPHFIHTKLKIVGGGPELHALQQKVSELKLKDYIDLTGYRNDVAEIMRNSDLFVLSSVYEAMPMTILEAMACGLPVISTNVGGVSHMISENEAWLVESNNAVELARTIYNVYLDKQGRETKSHLGRALVMKKYSIDRMVDEYMSIYGCEKPSPI